MTVVLQVAILKKGTGLVSET